MSARLRALLVFIGFAAAGVGSVALYRTTTGIAVNEGTPVAVRCRVRLAQDAINEIRDGGTQAMLADRYGTILAPARSFGDAGIVLSGSHGGLELYGPSPCEVLTDAGVPTKLVAEPHACACRMAAGACRVPLEDGGSAAAPMGITLQPGWAGAGCQRKPCIEIAGESSWPAVCPGG